MKIAVRLFFLACLSFAAFAGFAGCAAEAETTGIEAASETREIRYSAEDIAALAPGELLRLDLTLPNTVYTITYADPANLDRVIVVQSDAQYVLRDRVPATANGQGNTLKLVMLSGDLVVDPVSGASIAPQADGDEHIGTAEQSVVAAPPETCICPCCLTVGGKLYCCGAAD